MLNIDLFKLIFMAMYATGVTAASFYFFFMIVFGKIPEDNQQYANLILGFLIGSGVPTFLGYYFGTSQSTKVRPPDKDPTEIYSSTITETKTKSTTEKIPELGVTEDLKTAQEEVKEKL